MRAKFCRAKFPIPRIPEEEKTALVSELLDIIERQLAVIRYKEELIQQLRDEIARLKGEKARPTIRPSQLEKRSKSKEFTSEKRPGSEKRSKTAKLIIHEIIRIAPQSIPPGSVFKGYLRSH